VLLLVCGAPVGGGQGAFDPLQPGPVALSIPGSSLACRTRRGDHQRIVCRCLGRVRGAVSKVPAVAGHSNLSPAQLGRSSLPCTVWVIKQETARPCALCTGRMSRSKLCCRPACGGLLEVKGRCHPPVCMFAVEAFTGSANRPNHDSYLDR